MLLGIFLLYILNHMLCYILLFFHYSSSEKVPIRVIDPFTIKPLDKKTILENARATKGRIITVEDHYYEGKSMGLITRQKGTPDTNRLPLIHSQCLFSSFIKKRHSTYKGRDWASLGIVQYCADCASILASFALHSCSLLWCVGLCNNNFLGSKIIRRFET